MQNIEKTDAFFNKNIKCLGISVDTDMAESGGDAVAPAADQACPMNRLRVVHQAAVLQRLDDQHQYYQIFKPPYKCGTKVNPQAAGVTRQSTWGRGPKLYSTCSGAQRPLWSNTRAGVRTFRCNSWMRHPRCPRV